MSEFSGNAIACLWVLGIIAFVMVLFFINEWQDRREAPVREKAKQRWLDDLYAGRVSRWE